MLKKMLIQGTIAAAVIGFAAAVYASGPSEASRLKIRPRTSTPKRGTAWAAITAISPTVPGTSPNTRTDTRTDTRPNTRKETTITGKIANMTATMSTTAKDRSIIANTRNVTTTE